MPFPGITSPQWSTGLCGCFEDIESCCIGLWCPCILVGRTVEVLDQGATSCCVAASLFFCLHICTGLGCIYTCGYRARLRQKFGLPRIPCGDCLTDCCCLYCSVCQVHRELENRGINPKHGHVAPLKQYMGRCLP